MAAANDDSLNVLHVSCHNQSLPIHESLRRVGIENHSFGEPDSEMPKRRAALPA